MKRLISFGDIQQFRNIIKKVQKTAQYFGQDENDEPIIDCNAPMPKIVATASEKIHGTNASVCYSLIDDFWIQSKNNIITPEQDNAGCAFVSQSLVFTWIFLITELSKEYNIYLNKNIITIFFEWSGGSIQKTSACTGLDKRAIIFQHFKVSPIEPYEIESSKWYETKIGDNWISCKENNIFNIMDFKTWNFEIDFEQPLLSQNKMIEIVSNEVEPDSPAGKEMGKDGNTGEGIVVTFSYKDSLQRFKVKGDKHSKSKVKTLNPVDEEQEKIKIEFANYACSSGRLEQAWQTVFGINNETQEPDIKFTGNFLKAVMNDVIKEENDIMLDKGIEPKMISSLVSKIARTWFMTELDKS